jgi:hypothetical protein
VAFGLQQGLGTTAEKISCKVIFRDKNNENNLQKSGKEDLKAHYPSNINKSASGF